MKTPNSATRSFRAIAILEAIFTVSISHQTPVGFGMRTLPVAAFFVMCALVRIAIYRWLLDSHVGPSDRAARRAAEGGTLIESELRRADELLQRAPRVMATATAVAYFFTFPTVYFLYRWLSGDVELPAFRLPLLLASSVSAIFGAVSVVMPLISWTTAEAAGKNHMLASERGWHLDRAPRSIAQRLVLLAVCLAAAPAVQMIGANIGAEAISRAKSNAQETRALVAELAVAASSPAPDAAIAAVAARADATRTSIFISSEGKVRHLGGALPVWADAELWARAAAGPVSAPEADASVAATRVGSGTVVGVASFLPPLDASFVLRLANEVMGLVLLAVVSAWLLSRSVSLPLRQTAAMTQRAAETGDLSMIGSLPVAQADEIGTVMTNMNDLLSGMRSVAVAASAVGQGQLVVELTGQGDLPRAFRTMLEQLRGVVVEMRDTSTELASAATEIFAASQEQEAASTSHSTGMREISQTMESLSDSAAHVATAVQGVLGNAERTLLNTERMDARIEDLTGHANRIGDILEIIRDIADRTDLLALNGSLEASRAGEAGVGFSLVASEMRRLAERVTASVSDIKSLVSDIRESGASTVVATEESKALADATTQAARNITLVTQQQQSSTEQVSQHVRSVAEVVQQAAAATTQTRASADNLKRQAERLTSAVSRFSLSA